MPCTNCGGPGWHAWFPSGTIVWVACADCNDDGQKPKPDLCEACRQTELFCLCPRVV